MTGEKGRHSAGIPPSRSRLLLDAQLLEALAHYVLVDLRGRAITVPEELLHHAQICAVVVVVSGDLLK